ncbi:MAG: outer membrane protein assembly factor BamA precursor [Verrucomicrobiota bacterium]
MKRTLPPIVCLAAFAAILPSATQAQGTGLQVREIEVQYDGPATVSKERVLANMRTKVGQAYSEMVVEEDIRNLHASGNVVNVRIFGEPVGKDGVKVIVVMRARAKVVGVELEGVREFKASKIRDKISTKPGDSASEAALEADRQAILEFYRGKGYKDVEVTCGMEVNDKLGTARVKFTVLEGRESAIGAVRFKGNTKVSSSALMKVIKTRKHRFLWSAIVKSGRIVPEQLADDVIALREYYQNLGYSDVQIRPADVVQGKKKVEVVFHITEGERYTVGKVGFRGARLFPEEKLLGVTKLRTGSVYSPAAKDADVKALQDLYGAKGYVDLQVAARPSSGGRNVTDITFTLDEGTQAYVGRVNIAGNTRTQDKVIRRELALAPGEVFNTVRMEASKQRLNNLNYFSKVDVYPSETGAADSRDLNISLEEKRTGALNFGAGFSSIDSLLGFVEVSQGNFDLFNAPTFTGGGQKFRTRLQYGAQRKDASISLTEPYFLDRMLSLGGELFYHDASFVSDVYAEQRYGFELVTRKPINEFTFGRFGYRVEQIGVHGVASDASVFIKSQEGDRLKSQIFTGITYDSRDSVFLTRKGQRVDVSAFVAGGPLAGNIKTYGWNAEASKYLLFKGDTILTLNAQAGVTDGWAADGAVPIYDRLFLGGVNDMRGFRFRHVGGTGLVKDATGEPIGGKSLARATFELTVPVVDRVRAATFYDAGFVNEKAFDFTTSGYNSDYGFGVRLDLPIAPVRLDYGIPLKYDAQTSSRGRFNFNMGYQF